LVVRTYVSWVAGGARPLVTYSSVILSCGSPNFGEFQTGEVRRIPLLGGVLRAEVLRHSSCAGLYLVAYIRREEFSQRLRNIRQRRTNTRKRSNLNSHLINAPTTCTSLYKSQEHIRHWKDTSCATPPSHHMGKAKRPEPRSGRGYAGCWIWTSENTTSETVWKIARELHEGGWKVVRNV
jgi:hypothetical protein